MTQSRALTVCGQRLLGGSADTGVFRVVAIGDGLASKPARAARAKPDEFAFATIEVDERLAVTDEDRGACPYHRHGRMLR